MALLRKVGDEESGTGQWFKRGEDHGKPVRLRIRQVPPAVNREIRRRVYGALKQRKASNQSLAQSLEHLEAFALERAVYALVDSENLNLELGDAKAVEVYGELLGVKSEPGKEVALDGKLTAKVKEQLFDDFPRLAAWVSDKAESITLAEAEEEEEAIDSF